ncbi:MAG: hypothetical protein M1834_002975 [Cirrosporium novae-zelandiae]|nr:MAG: hypothetical protein M1834_002975 [Cirrosporium novae-zelandiae]
MPNTYNAMEINTGAATPHQASITCTCTHSVAKDVEEQSETSKSSEVATFLEDAEEFFDGVDLISIMTTGGVENREPSSEDDDMKDAESSRCVPSAKLEVAKSSNQPALMTDTMIGIYLTEKILDGPSDGNLYDPKLRRFLHYDKEITSIEYLGHGEQGIVFAAIFEGKKYALKVFKNTYYLSYWQVDTGKIYGLTPFVNECRAFARLDDLHENGDWAVECYGWMKLTDEQFTIVKKLVYVDNDPDLDSKDTVNLTRWAIVKRYMPELTRITDLPHIIETLEIAKCARMHDEDPSPDNYRGSRLVDLGCVKTWPHPLWTSYDDHAYDTHPGAFVESWKVNKDGTIQAGRWAAPKLRLKRRTYHKPSVATESSPKE